MIDAIEACMMWWWGFLDPMNKVFYVTYCAERKDCSVIFCNFLHGETSEDIYRYANVRNIFMAIIL